MIRDASVEDLGDVAALIRALADYERMADEVEWDLDQLGATLFGPDAAVIGTEIEGVPIDLRIDRDGMRLDDGRQSDTARGPESR